MGEEKSPAGPTAPPGDENEKKQKNSLTTRVYILSVVVYYISGTLIRKSNTMYGGSNDSHEQSGIRI